ncbi:MAG: ABC transporter ATP-binding protein [Phycisphaeraceae bacterium]|nr:ABC transporter ATP-binding protein [Phycisphaerae bacterium]MBX3393411.1 ABC transporter ATP-binding protein [Phycisphaeraceae bacterium]HRJ51042.1 ABC transporter ATP-binding protein [Phycisphaerales bacterium]
MSEPQSPQKQKAVKPSEPIISCRGIVKRFDGRAVLDGIDLDVMAGETMVIMGGSGCGKSTLLRLLIGAIKPDEGQIFLFGKDTTRMSEPELNEIRKKFGILFQSGALFNSMTLQENVALPIHEHTQLPSELIDIEVTIKLELVGLRQHADKYPAQISGGMKKRAGLARALALDPRLLFYDEPSAGLDPVTSAQIDQLIMDLSRKIGVTSVVVTHEMDSAFTIADRMAMLDKGRMLKAESRDWFDSIRKAPDDQASGWAEDLRLIRQFLRGDPEGPITERSSITEFHEELLGLTAQEIRSDVPSVLPTRGR